MPPHADLSSPIALPEIEALRAQHKPGRTALAAVVEKRRFRVKNRESPCDQGSTEVRQTLHQSKPRGEVSAGWGTRPSSRRCSAPTQRAPTSRCSTNIATFTASQKVKVDAGASDAGISAGPDAGAQFDAGMASNDASREYADSVGMTAISLLGLGLLVRRRLRRRRGKHVN